jgi:hypothetical protein
MKMTLDSTTDPKLLSARFGRYGHNPMKTVATDAKGGVRFQLPAGTKGIHQTGLSSFFALAGDFEIVAGYEWTDVTPPADGYGVSCGVSVDLEVIPPIKQHRIVSLARAHMPDKRGEGYLVVWEVTTEGQPNWEHKLFPTKSRKGKLALRRAEGEVVFLVADSPQEELREVMRLAFPEGKVRRTCLFADQGRSMTLLDAKLTDIRVRAEEIAPAIREREQSFAWGRWLTYGSFAVVGTVLFILYRREKRQQAQEAQGTG